MGRTMGMARGLGKQPENGLEKAGDKDKAECQANDLLRHLENGMGNDPWVWVFQGGKCRLSHNFALYLGF